MREYLSIVRKGLVGAPKENRTGVPSRSFAGAMFEHDMANGFPLLTTKSVPFRLVASELEFFIKGITDKKWLQDRDNHIWDSWCWQKKVPYDSNEETKKAMAAERDLGPIYGFQWRHFNANYHGYDFDYHGQGIDQLENIVNILENNPNSRRMNLVSWNPLQLDEMALPPCHDSFQVTVTDEKLNLIWRQRSVDTALGLPFNIASYGLLLHLLAKESGYEEGRLVGHFGDVHIYEPHVEGLMEQLSRVPMTLCKVETDNFTSIFDWEYSDSRVVDYKHHSRIDFGDAAV